MKKYTDHNSTPLKFHKFFHYVWTPITLLVSIILLFALFRGFSYNNVGLAVYVTFSVLNFALTAAYFIGFFRWKKYAWYCLFAQLISEAVLYTATLILSVFILPQYISTVIGVLIGFSIRGIPMGIYYYKRRGLFSTEGYNPKAAKAEVSPMHTAGRICPACGKEIAADTRFCIHCGAAVNTQPTATADIPVADAPPADTAEGISAAYTVQPAEETAGIAPTEQTIEKPVLEEIPPSLSPDNKAGRKLQKVHIALIAACLCAAVLGVLNIVQYTQIGSYKASADALSLQVNTLNETIDGYKNRIDQITKSKQDTETDAQLYNILAQFVTEEVPEYKSKTYYSSDYVLFVPMSSYRKTFTITAKLDDVTVSFYPVGESVTADYMEEWNGYSIDIYLIPEKRGVTTLHFSNDKNDDTFKVMIFVV